MPLHETRGSASALGFGFAGNATEPPGSITFSNGFAGLAYQPAGWPTVTVTLYGGCGTNSRNPSTFSQYGLGSVTTKTNVPVSGLYIYCPTGPYTSQWPSGGSGGIGTEAYASPSFSGGYGGAVCAAVWSGGVMVAAGGGGNASSNSAGRRGQSEGLTASNATNSASGNNGGNGAPTAPCYYGGGGGGGGYSAGGRGGQTNSGGNPGGNGASPSPTGTGSYGYSSITTNSSAGLGYATMSWG